LRRLRVILWLVLVRPWLLFFFFSSRRRHTTSKRDWSSDVCSSDLMLRIVFAWNISKIVTIFYGIIFVLAIFVDEAMVTFAFDSRSEERRVGKECRSRGRQYQKNG